MPKSIEVDAIRTTDCARWRALLAETEAYDFYHLPEFHRLAEIRGEGEARLWYYREDDNLILFPHLLRDIRLAHPHSRFVGMKDATCVTGFNGPLASTSDISAETLANFQNALNKYLEQEYVVSVFSRFNPLINQKFLLQGYGEILKRGVTLSVDLSPSPEEQFAKYRKNHKRDIIRLAKMGFTCRRVDRGYVDEFVKIYSHTMDRVQAESLYHFDRPYFDYLLREMPDVMSLWACFDGEKIAAIWLCSFCNGIIGMYLGANHPAYIRLSPTKYLQYEVSRWGHKVGAKKLQLGGGVGAQRDSLHHYKMGFGAQEDVYYTWRHVSNDSAYDALCKEATRAAAQEPEKSFFPVYRNPTISFCTSNATITSFVDPIRSRGY